MRLQGCAKTERLLAYILHEALWNAMRPRIAFERLMGKQKRRSGSTAAWNVPKVVEDSDCYSLICI
jgi:hypothetical protein